MEAFEDKVADEAIAQQAEWKDKSQERKDMKLENELGRSNIQIRGVPERIDKVEGKTQKIVGNHQINYQLISPN